MPQNAVATGIGLHAPLRAHTRKPTTLVVAFARDMVCMTCKFMHTCCEDTITTRDWSVSMSRNL